MDLVKRDDDSRHGSDYLLPMALRKVRAVLLLFIVTKVNWPKRLERMSDHSPLSGANSPVVATAPTSRRIRPSELAVVPVSLDERTPEWKRYTAGTPEALTFFSRLALGHYDGEGEPKEADYVFSAMFKLVWSVADRLAALHLKHGDVLSLMGRALFFRFLRDRGVVQDSDVRRVAPRATRILDCFVNAENAASTSGWLDRTFNGTCFHSRIGGSGKYFGRNRPAYWQARLHPSERDY